MELGQMKAVKPLDRYLSRLDVWALSLGCIIGWGAFVMPGTTFLPAAGPGGTVIAMTISTLVTLVIGYNYFVLMQRYPSTGGVYSYSKQLLGRDHAFLSAWFLCLSYVSLIPQNATMLSVICRILSGDALRTGIHYQVAGTEVFLTEILIIITVLIAVGLFAICMKPFLQAVQTALGIMLAVGVLAIAVIIAPHVSLREAFSSFSTMSASPLRGILTIVILAPWAFVGFEVVSLETAHFKFPVKKSGILILTAILVGGGIYCVMALAAILRQPESINGWQSYVGQLKEMKGLSAVPTFFVMESLAGKPGVWIIAVTAFSAVTSTIIGFYRASARILMNMAEDNILSHKFNKPYVCFLFLMGLSVVISAFGTTAVSWVVDLSSLGAIVCFGYVSVAVMRLAGQERLKRERIMGTAGLALTVCFAAAQLIPGISLIETMQAESYLLLAFWCLFGFAFYWRTMHTEEDHGQRNESITIAALFTLLTFSIVVWYVKRMLGNGAEPVEQVAAIGYSLVLMAFLLCGIIVVLMIHARLKKREIQLETEKIRMMENSQAKSRFLFNMSHDIRTPMNAIMGYTKLALKEPVTPEVRSYLEKIDLSGQRMLDLINDLLEMSRIDSGRMTLDEDVENICAIVAETRDLFSGTMQEKHIAFTVETASVLHPWVYCDRRNILRVLLSLVSNAYKFTPDGGEVHVCVRESAAQEPNHALYEIRVEDNGIGMSKEFSRKMFGAFERERTSTDSGLEGTGLGLTITKSILDLMGAVISVETAPGQGTKILIRGKLRLADAREPPEAAPNESQEKADVPIDFTRVRLLLVEDNLINMEIAQMILSQAGFMIETAENGQIAVDKVSEAEAGYYDAVLMDIQMPVMDGYTATRTIRQLRDAEKAKIPIIAMTANVFKEDEDKAFQTGMQAHIAKPIDVEVMMGTIRRVLTDAAMEQKA